MSKVKILFVYSTRGFAGLGRNLSIVLGGLDLSKFEPSVVFVGDKNDTKANFESRLQGRKIPFHTIDERGKFSFSDIAEIRKIAELFNADIVSCHGYKAKFYGAILSMQMPQKFLSIAHGWVTPGFKVSVYYFLDKLVSHFYDKIVLITEGQRSQLKGFFIPRSKLCVISNGIDVDSFVAGVTPVKLESEAKINIGVVSRLSPEKGVENSIRGFAKALAKEESLHLFVAGDGPERGFLEKECRELGVENKVTFLGHIQSTASFLAAIDIFVSSSKKEGMPNSLLEAQAFSLPCVLTNISGHRDVVVDGETGLLVKISEPLAFLEALLSLVTDPALRKELGKAGNDRVRKHFSVTERIEKLEQVYLELAPKA